PADPGAAGHFDASPRRGAVLDPLSEALRLADPRPLPVGSTVLRRCFSATQVAIAGSHVGLRGLLYRREPRHTGSSPAARAGPRRGFAAYALESAPPLDVSCRADQQAFAWT